MRNFASYDVDIRGKFLIIFFLFQIVSNGKKKNYEK